MKMMERKRKKVQERKYLNGQARPGGFRVVPRYLPNLYLYLIPGSSQELNPAKDNWHKNNSISNYQLRPVCVIVERRKRGKMRWIGSCLARFQPIQCVRHTPGML